MKKFLPFSLIASLFFVYVTFSQSTSEKEKPKLIDFGASLRPDYIKKKDESQVSKAENSNADDVIKIDTDLVVTDVLVLNEKGFAVSGLTKDDFVVNEDSVQQKTDTFSQGDGGAIPRSIVLIMDYSGSLLPFIKTSVAAAKVLVDKLKPEDRMAIVTDDVELLTNFTRDKQLLKDKLTSLENNALFKNKLGKSEQYSALMATLNELFDEEDVRPIVIFQTDGDEIGRLKGNFIPPVLPKNPPPNIKLPEIKERIFSFADVMTAAEKARTTIYTVIPGTRYINIPEDQQLERARKDIEIRRQLMAIRFPPPPVPKHLRERIEKMRKEADKQMADQMAFSHVTNALRMHRSITAIAFSTGGWAEHIETPDEAESIYSRLLWDINNRYLIGYYPTNQTRDGKRRIVKIEVKNHPEYKILARRYYFAPEN